MSGFRDPRDHVDVRRTLDRAAYDARLKAAARHSQQRRAAEAELAMEDPDRFAELISGAQDAAAERARAVHTDEAMLEHDDAILPGDPSCGLDASLDDIVDGL